jgi:phosphoribulokinase
LNAAFAIAILALISRVHLASFVIIHYQWKKGLGFPHILAMRAGFSLSVTGIGYTYINFIHTDTAA